MENTTPKFKKGDFVTLHFSNPSAIGYNGCLYKVVDTCGQRYVCESVNGIGFVWASAEELIPQKMSSSSFRDELIRMGRL